MDKILKGLKIIILSMVLLIPFILLYLYLRSQQKTIQTTPTWKIVDVKNNNDIDEENLEKGLEIFKDIINKIESNK